jgi:hypothetical protein
MNSKFKAILDKIVNELETLEGEARTKLVQEYRLLIEAFQVHHAITQQVNNPTTPAQ